MEVLVGTWKSLKALLHGYVLFDVNGDRFLTYYRANRRLQDLKGQGTQQISVTGLNIFLLPKVLIEGEGDEAWRCFYFQWRTGRAVTY